MRAVSFDGAVHAVAGHRGLAPLQSFHACALEILVNHEEMRNLAEEVRRQVADGGVLTVRRIVCRYRENLVIWLAVRGTNP